jgi:hypothetical protein
MDKPKRNVFVDKNTKQDETPGKRRKRKKFKGKLTVPEPKKPPVSPTERSERSKRSEKPKILKQKKPMPEPINPRRRKMLDKQKQDQMVKQNLTQDYAFTGTPGAIAEPAGVTIPASKKPKLALRGGGRAYGRNS